MKIIGPIARGLLLALLSAAVVLGAMSLSLAETGAAVAQLPLPPSDTPTAVMTLLPGTPSPTAAPSATTTRAALLPTTPTCQKPPGWIYYVIQSGDTLETLTQTYGISIAQITAANCLLAPGLVPGAVLALPATRPPTPSATVTASASPTPTPGAPTATGSACVRPPGWVPYAIKSGDTLYALSRAFGVSVGQLQAANCMGASTFLRTGTRIYVPYVPTRTPPPEPTQPVITRPADPTATATATRTAPPPATPMPSPTATPTAPATDTPTPTLTATPTASPTPTETLAGG